MNRFDTGPKVCVTLRELLENFLYDNLPMFSVVGWTWYGFCRDLDPGWSE